MTSEEQITVLKAENSRLEAENEAYKKHFAWLDGQLVKNDEKINAIGSQIGEQEVKITTLLEKLKRIYSERDRFFSKFFSSLNLEGCEPEGRS